MACTHTYVCTYLHESEFKKPGTRRPVVCVPGLKKKRINFHAVKILMLLEAKSMKTAIPFLMIALPVKIS